MFELESLETRCLFSIPTPVIPSAIFNVTSYGAIGNGTTNNTTAIQNAINAAKNAGGGTVEFPAASSAYLSGPLNLASNINFQIDAGAELQALPYGTYPNSGKSSVSDFITAKSLSNFEISGSGTIDGNGSAWWSAYNSNNSIDRPRILEISNCNTLQIQNIHLQNAPQFHIAFGSTNNVTVNGVTITSPATSPNTDGIDPAGQHYLIENCNISTGDDNIAVKPEDVFCGDITVTGCTFGFGHGMSIGGETNDGLNGMTVTNCTFTGTTAGIRLKAARGQGGLVQNVSYSNLTMTDVEYPININSYYPHSIPTVPPQDPAQPVTSTTPIWQNITISNVTASWDTTGDEYSNSYCGIIWGLPEEPVNTVSLTNVQISAKYGMDLDHVRNVQISTDSTFNAASGGSLISTKSAASPYDAQLFVAVAPQVGGQQFRLVNSGSGVNEYHNGVLQMALDPSVFDGIIVNAPSSGDTVLLDFSAGNFKLPVTVVACDTLAITGSSTSDAFALDSSDITHGSTVIPLANIANLSVTTGSFSLMTDLDGPSLQINAGATVQLTADQHLASLGFSGDGTLDIGNQIVYLNESGPTADNTVQSQLTSGYNNDHWNGTGIISSLAASNSLTTAVGYKDDGEQITIKYSWVGDANLDGVVDADDFSLFMVGWLNQKPDWFYGNFNFDPKINGDDSMLLSLGAAISNGQSLPNSLMIQSAALPASNHLTRIFSPIFLTLPDAAGEMALLDPISNELF